MQLMKWKVDQKMDYYEILSINQDADPDEIKRAYYSAVKKHSPDKDPKMFKEIREAYENLSKPAKREEYDRLFSRDMTDQVKQELLAAQNLLANHQYKEVVLRLTDKKKPKLDNSKLNLMLGKAYLEIGKSGTADSLAKKILEDEPDNADALILLASACLKRGHYIKANDYFVDWLEEYPESPAVWKEYLDIVGAYFPWKLPYEIDRAFDINKTNLKEISHFYLIGVGTAMKHGQRDRALEFLEEYAKLILDGMELDKEAYVATVDIFMNFAKARDLRPCLIRTLPILLHNKFRPHAEEQLAILEIYAEWVTLSNDARVSEVLYDYTELLINFDDCGSCTLERNTMELYIIEHLDDLRPDVQVLRKDYPKLYACNPKFFGDVLDTKKANALHSQAGRIHRNLIRQGAYNNLDDFPVEKPYIRETPKVGRNAPCPCGSGKKFKRCCG